LLVDQQGVACHTGRRSCFFRAWREGRWVLIAEPQVPPDVLYPGGDRRARSASNRLRIARSAPPWSGPRLLRRSAPRN